MKRDILKTILFRTSLILRKANIYTYHLDAEILIARILNCDRVKIYSNFDKLLNSEQINLLNELVLRRTKYEPISYLIKRKEFYGYTFYVNNNVLIPRPETEFLIEEILEYDLKKKTILDIGTGCGNIGITIKKIIPESNMTCTDIDSKALKVAQYNAQSLLESKNDIQFMESDVYANIDKKFDYIISNPPYIPVKRINHLSKDVKNFEPHIALDGGEDGMMIYRKIISELSSYLKPNGLLLLEIDPIVIDSIIKLTERTQFKVKTIRKDYNDFDRVLVLEYENKN